MAIAAMLASATAEGSRESEAGVFRVGYGRIVDTDEVCLLL